MTIAPIVFHTMSITRLINLSWGKVIATVKEPRNLPLEVEYTIVRSRFNQKAVCESLNENDRGEGE